ncbi:DE-cadherin-like isoform X2 [Anopheles merus]|uniref:DE-cadherin-like isoform X2 n=1 Tax=Anopheles merus TaxID=30066 RepID=UPI001BE427AD|nr:DE-cadherin-like isoform X2 [Anopheles merus]
MTRQIGFVLLLISSNWIHCHCFAATDFKAPVNHKPSFHNCGEYKPTFKEEQEPGTSVLRVTATDPDQSQTVKYSILNVTRQEELFTIDENTGEIFSAQIFDRDPPYRDTEFYITVRATDNGLPSLDDVCTIKVTILDINDNPPVFEKDYYEAFVSMNTTLRQHVTIITAKDIDDQTNDVFFEIVKEYEDSSYFEIDQHTGVLTLAKRIDRHPGEYYALRVRAYNQGCIENESEHPEVDVKVRIIDADKRLPYFTKVPEAPVKLHENFTAFDQVLAEFEANSNINNESTVIFKIVRGKFEQTNSMNTFLLEQIDNTAHIKLARALDYERVNEYTITVRATNRHDIAVEAEVKIMILDVNDNIPVIIKDVSYLEYELIDNSPVIQIHAYDLDATSANNIISYSIAESNQLHFTIDSHTGTVTKQNRFNDDEKDIYFIKIFASDNAPSALFRNDKPNMSSHTLIVKIINRDLNIISHNAVTNIQGLKQRSTNGNTFHKVQSYEQFNYINERHIIVHNYEGTLTDKLIRSVYVNHDQEDLPNKMFLWDEMTPETNRKLFKLNINTGMITMLKGTPEGIYNLAFTVIEESSYFPRHNVSARVTVTVKNISAKTVNQSGSIRFYNVTAETFISQTLGELNTPMYRLQQSIASILDTSPDQVDIFTINNRKLARGAFLDVFFAVDDTIYTSSEVLNAVLSLHLRKLEKDVGYRIVTVGIDECIEKGHTCAQTCKNKVLKTAKPIVVHTNTSSFVGMTTLVQAQCIPQIESSLVACLNGGTFQNGKCKCPMGFEGSLCEKLDICFDGSGYAIYPSINSGNVNNISIELLPRHKDGLVFYMGPLKYDPSLKTSPFLALEINDGMLVLLLDYGTGTSRFEHQQIVLHEITKVQVILQPYRIEIKTVTNKMVSSRSHYENKDWSGFLTGNVSLQLGVSSISLDKLGSLYSWKYVPYTKSFDGCLRNLTINGRTVDFTQTSHKHNVLFNSQGFTAVGKQTFSVWIVALIIAIMTILIIIVIGLKDFLKSWIKILIRKLQTESMNMMVELHPAPEQLPCFTEVDERCVGLFSGLVPSSHHYP